MNNTAESFFAIFFCLVAFLVFVTVWPDQASNLGYWLRHEILYFASRGWK